MSGHDLAGVRDFNNQNHRRYVQKDLGLDDASYVNSGVLLFNTQRLRAKDFRSCCLKVLGQLKLLNCPDQDMINIVCKGNILMLDSGWNYLWNYGFSRYRDPPDGMAWFQDDLADSNSKRFIIHYSSAIKPWSHPHYEDADLFWQCARESPAYSEILKIAISKKVQESRERINELRKKGAVQF
jgi:lipopolysaccharide biosynthesis glycosyltransferase